jgi:GNAT superfamily N-acetyltransferase
MPSSFDLRPSTKADLAFCWPIYRDALKPLSEAGGGWDEKAQQHLVEQSVGHEGTSILCSAGADAGWVQVTETRYAVELRQLFVAPGMRNKGLGTSFLGWMKERADRKRKDLTLEILANSPARQLYERLGFKAVKTDGGKVMMRY